MATQAAVLGCYLLPGASAMLAPSNQKLYIHLYST